MKKYYEDFEYEIEKFTVSENVCAGLSDGENTPSGGNDFEF